MKADVIFLSHNRVEFTRVSFEEMLKNTNPELVGCVHVIDDASTDGGREWLIETCERTTRLPVQLHLVSHHAVVPVMNEGIRRCTQPIIAKLDNDTVVPPQWLDISLSVMERWPDVGMLGIDTKNPVTPCGPKQYQYTKTGHIGGIGLFRRSLFTSLPKQSTDPKKKKYHGFTEFQWGMPGVLKGWIAPGIPTILLDRVPIAPYPELVKKYQEKGWQRGCGPYPENENHWRWRFK